MRVGDIIIFSRLGEILCTLTLLIICMLSLMGAIVLDCKMESHQYRSNINRNLSEVSDEPRRLKI